MLTVGLVPFVPMLLTIKDGQGVASDIDGAVRVIILSGAAEGQDVPQGAVTVDCGSQHLFMYKCMRVHIRGKKGLFTWAFAPTATRARAAMKNFMFSSWVS